MVKRAPSEQKGRRKALLFEQLPIKQQILFWGLCIHYLIMLAKTMHGRPLCPYFIDEGLTLGEDKGFP